MCRAVNMLFSDHFADPSTARDEDGYRPARVVKRRSRKIGPARKNARSGAQAASGALSSSPPMLTTSGSERVNANDQPLLSSPRDFVHSAAAPPFATLGGSDATDAFVMIGGLGDMTVTPIPKPKTKAASRSRSRVSTLSDDDDKPLPKRPKKIPRARLSI